MAKKLKTLTLPNAQGEPVTYELHPDWDKIDGKPKDFGTPDLGSETIIGILPPEHGGTGNTTGYIQTGAKEGSSIGNKATIEGTSNIGSGESSHVEGAANTASGDYSHTEGVNSEAGGDYSHAEGVNTYTSGVASHAEGANSKATGGYSHAEGNFSQAKGEYSHAEGLNTIASGVASHAEGEGTVANADCSHAQGRYNIADTDKIYAHIVGNGSSSTSRSNAHTLDWDGNAWYAGSITATKLILGPESYGTALPETGVEGQIFFLIGGSSGIATDDGNGIITLG